jgi:hypothetical protein
MRNMDEYAKVQVKDCMDVNIDFNEEQKETIRRILREELETFRKSFIKNKR